jgi:drug/metabolite transporter (DMT)-like permease
MHPLTPYALVVLACAIWGGNWVTARWIIQEVSPLTLTFWRCLFPALIAGAIAAHQLRASAAAIRSDWKMLALIGVLGTVVFSTFGYFGVRYTTATNAALIGASGPFVQVLLSWLILRHTITPLQAAGMTVSLAGAVAIISAGTLDTILDMAFNPGDLLLLGGVLAWQLYTVLIGRRQRDGKPHVEPGPFLFFTGMAGAVAALPGYAWDLAAGTSVFPLTTPVLIAAAFLFVLPGYVAFFCWVKAVPVIGPNRATFFNPLIPVFGVIGAVLFLDEQLHGYHVAGFVLVVLGLVLVSIRRAQ